MARSPTRTRKVLLAVTLAMLAVVLVAWGVSYWLQITMSKSTPQVDIDPAIAATAPEVLSQVETRSCTSVAGSIAFKRTIKGSLFRVPIPSRSHPQPVGWVVTRNPLAGQYPSVPGIFHLHWPASISVLGVEGWVHADTYVRIQGLTVGYWSLAFGTGGVAFWLWWPQRRSARRRAEGLCLRCGYDRRGLAPAAACPECGAGAPASVADAQAPPTV